MSNIYILFSFLGHLSIVIVMIVMTWFAPVQKKNPQYQKISIKNITKKANSKKPAVPIKKQAVAEAKKEVKKEPKKELKKSAKTKTPEQATSKALQKKKANKDKETKAESVEENQKKAESLINNALASLAEEQGIENQEAVDNVLSALEAESMSSMGEGDYGDYVDLVGTILRNQWSYPNLGRQDNFKVIIRIFVDGTGLVTEYKIEESSEREDFDASAMRAVSQFTHFPIPPENKPVNFVVTFNLLEEEE